MFWRAISSLSVVLMVTISNVAHSEGRAISAPGKRSHLLDRKIRSDSAAPAAPCSRGGYKGYPACFGDDEKDILPTPSAGSLRGGPSASGGPSIKPTANINPRPSSPGGAAYQSDVVYQSNGNAVTSNYGGGVKLELPF